MEYTDRKELLYKEGVRLLKEHGKASSMFYAKIQEAKYEGGKR